MRTRRTQGAGGGSCVRHGSHPHLPESTNTACKVTVRDVSLLPEKDGTLNKLNVSIFPEVPKPKTLKAHKFTRTSFSLCRPETKGVQSMEMHRVQLGMDLT